MAIKMANANPDLPPFSSNGGTPPFCGKLRKCFSSLCTGGGAAGRTGFGVGGGGGGERIDFGVGEGGDATGGTGGGGSGSGSGGEADGGIGGGAGDTIGEGTCGASGNGRATGEEGDSAVFGSFGGRALVGVAVGLVAGEMGFLSGLDGKASGACALAMTNKMQK
nr:hypothetical protein Iba_chr13bCG0060 [Ipomoea batatas]